MEKHLTTKELPAGERPYEKFQAFGPSALSDAELLAVVIRSGANGKRAVDVAQEFLSREGGSLLGICRASISEMQGIPGIGQVKAIQLKCVAELAKRIAEATYKKNICMTDAKTVAAYYMERLRHEKQERLIVSMFDSKCALLSDKLLSIGGVSAAFVEPREIFLAALRHNAVHIILLHNHPSGSPDPSPQDDAVTERVLRCGALLGVPLADHIIIGDNSYYSYREQRKLPS